MFLLGHDDRYKIRPAMDAHQNHRPSLRGYACLRVVRFGANIRLQHNALLRRHSPREEQAIEKNPLLDQPRVLHDLRHRNVSQVDRAGFLQILHKFLDFVRLYYSFCEYKSTT